MHLIGYVGNVKNHDNCINENYNKKVFLTEYKYVCKIITYNNLKWKLYFSYISNKIQTILEPLTARNCATKETLKIVYRASFHSRLIYLLFKPREW